MVEGGPIDVLTGDWLAELTMLILWKGFQHDRSRGWARTFLVQMEQVLGTCVDRNIKVVTNAGGLNPSGLADQVRALADRLGLAVSVAHVEGDDPFPRLGELRAAGHLLSNLDTGEPRRVPEGRWCRPTPTSGAGRSPKRSPRGADVVICPRVTDASLVVGPAAWHHRWSPTDWDRLAGAVVAGHVIECGPQATGGNYSFLHRGPRAWSTPASPWPRWPRTARRSSPSTRESGGEVSIGTVTAQLLYEIGGHHYPNTDVVARFDTITVSDEGEDRVRLSGIRGLPAPDDLKVSVNLLGGWRNSMTFVLTGLDVGEKADLDGALAVRGTRAATGQFADFDARLIRSDKDDAPTNAEATASSGSRSRTATPTGSDVDSRTWQPSSHSPGYPGLHLTAPPTEGAAYGVFWPALIPAGLVVPAVVHADGTRREVPHTAYLAGGGSAVVDSAEDASLSPG